MKSIYAFILKHWVLLLPVLCLLVFIIFPSKPRVTFIAGMAAMGFVWSVYHAFNHYIALKKMK